MTRAIARTTVRRAVMLAVAAAPTLSLFELQCETGCDIQWVNTIQGCMNNPWPTTRATVSVGTIASMAEEKAAHGTRTP